MPLFDIHAGRPGFIDRQERGRLGKLERVTQPEQRIARGALGVRHLVELVPGVARHGFVPA